MNNLIHYDANEISNIQTIQAITYKALNDFSENNIDALIYGLIAIKEYKKQQRKYTSNVNI